MTRMLNIEPVKKTNCSIRIDYIDLRSFIIISYQNLENLSIHMYIHIHPHFMTVLMLLTMLKACVLMPGLSPYPEQESPPHPGTEEGRGGFIIIIFYLFFLLFICFFEEREGFSYSFFFIYLFCIAFIRCFEIVNQNLYFLVNKRELKQIA